MLDLNEIRREIVVLIDGTRLPVTERGTDFRTWDRATLERLATQLTARMIADAARITALETARQPHREES